MSAPLSHLVDAQRLEADAVHDLFQIELVSGAKLFLKVDHDETWKGDLYEGTGIQLTGVGKAASDEKSRPKLTIRNYDGVYNSLVARKLLYNAKVSRYRVLKADLAANPDTDNYTVQSWRVRRIPRLRRELIELELRDQLDGQFFLTPGRQFLPPEFSTVSLA